MSINNVSDSSRKGRDKKAQSPERTAGNACLRKIRVVNDWLTKSRKGILKEED